LVLASFDDAGMAFDPSRSISAAVIFYGTMGLLLFGPLAFGAVEPWSIYVLEAGAAILFAVWTVQQVTAQEMQIAGNPLFFPMFCFAALIALQLITGPARAACFIAAMACCVSWWFNAYGRSARLRFWHGSSLGMGSQLRCSP
jgi:hypothetical protein